MNASGRSGEANLIGARDLEHQLAEAQRIAHVGSWQWDVTTDRRWWSEETYRIAGVGEQNTEPTNAQFVALVHHDDRAMVQEAARAAVEDGAGYDVEHRIVRADGEERIVRSVGEVSRDESGRPLLMFGTAQDLTEQRQAEQALRLSEARYRQIIEAASEGIWTLDTEDRTTFANRAMTEMLGCQPEAMLGRSVLEFIDPAGADQIARNLALLRQGISGKSEVHFRRADGSALWTLVAADPLYDEHGSPVGALAMVTDITERKAGEAERARLAAIVESSGDAVISLNRELMIETWNEGATRLYGHNAEAVLGRPARSLMVRDPAANEPLLSKALSGVVIADVDREHIHKDGRTIAVSVTASPIFGDDGRVTGVSLIAHDITSRRAAADRERETQELMTAITENMAEGMIAYDTEHGLVYMNGAAEKMLDWRLDELRGRRPLHDVIHYMREDGSPYPAHDCPMMATMDHGETVRVEEDTFIRRDGSPLPVAYSCSPLIAGSLRGAVVVFSDISERVAERRRRQGEIDALVWVGRIRDALDEDQFVLYAQPIIDLRSGAVVQHELLIRMLDRHESGSIIPPGQFLPVAEKYGLIGEIDRWVIGQAAKLAASGRNVEFNLSAASVTDPDMASTIESAFKEANASPQRAVCEITETALLADDVAAEACVRRLAASGFGVALDDFGTGYGGFSYLSRLPVSIVKIDVEFVRDLLENEQSQHVVRAIVDLAKAFEKQTVAEGVEDLAALQLLKTMGVDFAQGYAIGRPAPLEDMFPAPAPP